MAMRPIIARAHYDAPKNPHRNWAHCHAPLRVEMPLLPVSLNIEEALCLVVGGGKIAHRKTTALLECGAKVRLVAPQLNEVFQPILNQINYQPRGFHSDDCEGARLVFACTNDNKINSQVANAAEVAGIWCNVCDDAGKSTFHSTACVRRDDITVSISTNGQSPALARFLKTKIEDCIGPEYGELAGLLAQHRKKEVSADKFRLFFESSSLEKVLSLIRHGNIETAKELLNTKLT